MTRVLWLGLVLSIALPARADEQRALRLAPTPESVHRAHTDALSQRLVRLLTALPGVARAEVQLLLPAPFAEPLDAPLPAPRATVVLVHAGSASLSTDVVRILRGSVSGLVPEGLTLIERTAGAGSPERDPGSLVQVGPFRVHAGSALGLRTWLAVSLFANALLAAVVLLRLRQK